MARIVLSVGDIRAWARTQILQRSRVALQIYRKQPLERDRPNYPFARHPEDGSIRNASSSTIRPTRGGATITVQSRGAPYIEGGNGPGMITAQMAIPLRRRRKKRTRFITIDESTGKAWLRVERVRSYRGQRLLERSAQRAFGIRQTRRPPLH